jgi:glutamate-1-semialdehyde 2,1-aminomutase
VMDRVVAAARSMQQDGWWWSAPAASNKSIRKQVLREMLANYGERLGLKWGTA